MESDEFRMIQMHQRISNTAGRIITTLCIIALGIVMIAFASLLASVALSEAPLAGFPLLLLPWATLGTWTYLKRGARHRERSSYWLLAIYCFCSLFAFPAAIVNLAAQEPFTLQGIAFCVLGGTLFWYCWWVLDSSLETLQWRIYEDWRSFFPRPGLAWVVVRFSALYWLAILAFGIFYALISLYDKQSFNKEDVGFFDLLYFSGVTLSTLGYGDVVPRSMIAKATVIVQVFLGITITVIYLGAAVAHFQMKKECTGKSPQ
jgi:hypothetical protein